MGTEVTAIEPSMKVRTSPRVYARAFGDEMVLLEFGLGEYFGLDPIGAEVWKHLEAGEALPRIAGALVERYDVGYDAALRDLLALVDEMREHGLVDAG